MYYILTIEYYLALEKEGGPVVCNNMGEPGGHYATWNKPVTQGQRCMFPLTWGI